MNSTTAFHPSAPRRSAELAARQRLLNSYLREAGRTITVTGDGLVRVTLLAQDCAIVVELRHRCGFGQHIYGDELWLERAGFPRTRIDHDELVSLLLDEVVAVAAQAISDPGDGARQKIELAEQIESSIAATTRYLRRDRPPPPREPRALTRHAEQSMVYGHPFHPTPKSSQGFGDDLARYAPELGATFTPHWLAINPSLVLERRVASGPWVPDEVAERARARLASARGDYPLLPVHPWQAAYLAGQPRVTELTRDGKLVPLGPLGSAAYPTSSVRTVCDPAFATSWKLPLHVRITNFIRNNPLPHLVRATDASALVAALAPDWPHEGFGVLIETGFRTVDPAAVGDDLAADFSVLYRGNPFADGHAAPRVVAGLLEDSGCGVPDLIHEVRRAAGTPDSTPPATHIAEWLRRYLRISLVPLLEVFGSDGVSFEAHVQNSLLHTENGWPARFWVRDMEGTSVSRTRLRRRVVSEDSPLLYDDEDAWLRLRYHAVTNHLGHLVHVLGHYGQVDESILWRTVRELLAEAACEPAEDLLGTPVLPAKANLVSRFAGRGENPIYVDVPNPLFEGSR
ncbi:MAG: IucA/IucC family protein [Haloechinothrix sp.]